jgi:type I restriction enzyme S subunit
MSEKKNVPKLRFPEFTEPWEQRKLGDMGSTFNGLSGKTKDDFGHGKAKFITYMNVFSNPIADLTMTESIEIDKKQKSVKAGDVFFTTSSETPDEVGMSSVMPEDVDNIYLNSFCFGYRPTEKFDLNYLAYVLRADSFRKEMTFLAQGISRYNISKNKVMEVCIPVPTIEEQTKVGRYFRNLDNLITLHQRKLDHVKDLKKSMLQKMFPKNGQLYPEVRFPEFTDAWEQRKLGEIATFINGRAYSQSELLSSGKYKVLRVGNFYTNDSWYYSDLELGDKYYADYGDLLYTWSATFGPHIWLGDKVIYHYHIWKIDLSNQLEKQFAVQLLEQDKANILSSKNGSTMVHITKERMEQKDVIIPPSIKEQQKIGAFFIRLDNLITLHQRELDHIKLLKKGMLQQMFV